MSSPSARIGILNGVDAVIWDAFSNKTGTEEKLFRKHRVGPLKPSQNIRPVYTVTDAGQMRERDEETDNSTDLVLSVNVTLQIAGEWHKVDDNENWTQRVEKIISLLHGNLLVGQGLTRFDYMDDEPLGVIWQSNGAKEAAWEIVFEARRFIDVGK